jgi:hypothetical protein
MPRLFAAECKHSSHYRHRKVNVLSQLSQVFIKTCIEHLNNMSSAFFYYGNERDKICKIFPGHKRLQLQVTIHKMGDYVFWPKRKYHQLEDRDKENRRERKIPQNYDNIALSVSSTIRRKMWGWCTTV